MNATHSPRLTEAENRWLQHVQMWGSDAWPILKLKRGWIWDEAWGVAGAPTVYKTKREAMDAIECYIQALLDRLAGRR